MGQQDLKRDRAAGRVAAAPAAPVLATLALAALALGLAACAGEPEPPPAQPPASRPEARRAPGEPSLGDLVDDILSRRRVIEQLEDLEEAEP